MTSTTPAHSDPNRHSTSLHTKGSDIGESQNNAVSRNNEVSRNNAHLQNNAVRGLIVMDIDATVIDEEVIDQLAMVAGVEDQVAPITAQAMRGELDFEQALRHRVSLLRGLPSSVFAQVYRTLHPTHGVRELIETAHQHGFKVGVVSGGFHEVADMLVRDLHIDYCLAHRLEIANGVLTGNVEGDIVTKTRKQQMLSTWAQECGLSMDRTVAIGDGANDIPMILSAGVGIAFCAKPKTRASAPFAIDTRDLMLAWPIIAQKLHITN